MMTSRPGQPNPEIRQRTSSPVEERTPGGYGNLERPTGGDVLAQPSRTRKRLGVQNGLVAGEGIIRSPFTSYHTDRNRLPAGQHVQLGQEDVGASVAGGRRPPPARRTNHNAGASGSRTELDPASRNLSPSRPATRLCDLPRGWCTPWRCPYPADPGRPHARTDARSRGNRFDE